MNPIEIHPIGLARTPYPITRRIPRQGDGPARIEIFPPYRPALDGLQGCSHIWILGFFHNAQRDVLQARPRKTSPEATPRGVFGMRSPVRPNPLGLTCSRILELLPDQIVVDRLDFHDETPIVDIKPYSPGWDLILSARSAHRYDPSRYDFKELQDALSRDAENALGVERSQSPTIRALVSGLAELARVHQVDLRDDFTRFVLPHPDGRVDVLLSATGASFGNERITLTPLPSCVVLRTCTHSRSFDVHAQPAGVRVDPLEHRTC